MTASVTGMESLIASPGSESKNTGVSEPCRERGFAERASNELEPKSIVVARCRPSGEGDRVSGGVDFLDDFFATPAGLDVLEGGWVGLDTSDSNFFFKSAKPERVCVGDDEGATIESDAWVAAGLTGISTGAVVEEEVEVEEAGEAYETFGLFP